MKGVFRTIAYICVLCLLTACSKTCYLQEVEESSFQSQPCGGDMYGPKLSGYERYQNMKSSHHMSSKYKRRYDYMYGNIEKNFKVRFCNYMLGFRNDDPEQLICLAKEIADGYKKMRMYDAARKFDSYRDVLLFGKDTIAESWDDTIDLLEEYQELLEQKRKEEECRIKKEKEKSESFFGRLFGSDKKCENEVQVKGGSCPLGVGAYDMIAIPAIISEPPGSTNYQNPLVFPTSGSACGGGNNRQQTNQYQQPYMGCGTPQMMQTPYGGGGCPCSLPQTGYGRR